MLFRSPEDREEETEPEWDLRPSKDQETGEDRTEEESREDGTQESRTEADDIWEESGGETETLPAGEGDPWEESSSWQETRPGTGILPPFPWWG